MELLATIAILAVLVGSAMFFVAGYVTWSKNTADLQTYKVLNAALDRYKTEGGGTTGLTQNATIGRILAAMQTPVSWAGMSHQFLQSSVTYAGRSIGETGHGATYHFSRYNTYSDGSGDASNGTGGGSGTTTYAAGVGYISNGDAAGGYPNLIFLSSTGYVTLLPAGGTQQVVLANGSTNTALGVASSVTFWSSDASGNASGTLQGVYCTSDNLTSINIASLSALGTNGANGGGLDVSGNAAITGSASALNALYAQLPARTVIDEAWIGVNDDSLAAAGSNVAVANHKNWQTDAPIGAVTPQAYPGTGGIVVTSTSGFTLDFITTSTGYLAYLSGGSTTMVNLNANSCSVTGLPSGTVTVWPVDATGTANGYITQFDYSSTIGNSVTAISGVNGQQYLTQFITLGGENIGSLNISNCPNLGVAICQRAQLNSLNVSSCPSLTCLYANRNNTGCTVNVTGDSALTTTITRSSVGGWSNGTPIFEVDPTAVITGP